MDITKMTDLELAKMVNQANSQIIQGQQLISAGQENLRVINQEIEKRTPKEEPKKDK